MARPAARYTQVVSDSPSRCRAYSPLQNPFPPAFRSRTSERPMAKLAGADFRISSRQESESCCWEEVGLILREFALGHGCFQQGDPFGAITVGAATTTRTCRDVTSKQKAPPVGVRSLSTLLLLGMEFLIHSGVPQGYAQDPENANEDLDKSETSNQDTGHHALTPSPPQALQSNSSAG